MVEHRANTHLADIFQTSIVQVYQLKNAAMLARYVSEEPRLMPMVSKTRRAIGLRSTKSPT